jgi:hypothetical protein
LSTRKFIIGLATEPRWPRISGTFGEDADLSSRMTDAYIKGFQGDKVDINLDRPAVIPEISKYSKALIANYGTSDDALLDVVFGKYKPEGHLPFELPSSMEAVRNQKEDMPYDSKDPLYKFGFGLNY